MRSETDGGDMNYNDVKRALLQCPDLPGIDDASAVALFWLGEAQTLEEGTIIYAEGDKLDHTFCLLLSGDLIVEKGGTIIGGISEQQIFGEMAYLTNRRARTATVRVGSPQAAILKFQLAPGELDGPQFSGLRKCLEMHTWNRFVSTSQCPSECEEMVTA